MKGQLYNLVSFSVGNCNFISLVNQIEETLKLPAKFVVLPGTKNWLVGFSKFGGVELPLVDLQEFGSVPGDRQIMREVLVVRRTCFGGDENSQSKIGIVVNEIKSLLKVDVLTNSLTPIDCIYFGTAVLGEIDVDGMKAKLLDLRVLANSEKLTQISIS